MTAFNALQVVIALAACLMDVARQDDIITPYRSIFNNTVELIGSMQISSPIYAKVYPALQELQ
jgi:hypothetical protein